ncbi:MAG: carbohydrate kinase [Paludibacteraceae bacterium]|nr:carbohydrate kinase [Paludibacteraceae bacterium]
MEKTVVGLGEALFDCLPTGRKLGGAPANFAYHVSQFGLTGYAVSAIGNDELGKEITDTFDKVGLHYILPVVKEPTGTVQVTLDDKGIPQYEICLGVAWDNIPFTDEMKALAQKADAVCFGSLAQRSKVSRATINAFLDTMPKTALKVFDINLRQHWYSREVIETSLQKSNILKINDEEILVVKSLLELQGTTYGELCLELIRRYDLQMVILTCGTEGSYVFSEQEESFLPTPKVQVADTVGAGDSFTGAFVALLLQGKSIREAHEMAVKVSAFVCTQAGAMPRYGEMGVEG